MYWRTSFVISLAAAALFGAPQQSARAAEAYICAPDIVVYVEAGELEKKKRTDACVASHFGLTVDQAAVGSAKAPPPPVAKKARPVAAKSAPVKFTTLIDAGAAREPSPKRVADASSSTRSPIETEYRRIRILNAATPETAWFHHSK